MKPFGAITICGITALGLIVQGCAHYSQGTQVIARGNPDHAPAFTDRIALAERTANTSELDALKQSVTQELTRRGVNLVPPKDSEYVLSFWVEENGIDMPPMTLMQPVAPSPWYEYAPGYGYRDPVGSMPYSGVGTMYVPVTIERAPLPTKGVRLRLYVTHPKGTNLLETAWEGYIDGGRKMAPAHYDALVGKLMDYFGTNYSGQIERVETKEKR